MKRGRRRAVALLPAALMGCGGLLPRPDEVLIGEKELQALVERSFPLERRLLEVIELQVGTPRLTLLPSRNRIAVVLRVQARDRLSNRSFGARLDFDSALRWEPADRTLRLHEVRVNDLQLDGDAGEATRATASRLAPLLAEKMLEQLALYRLSPEREARLAQRGVRPQSVEVTGAGVLMRLAPAT